MLYQFFRDWELEGVIHFAILLYILNSLFPKYKKPWSKASYWGFSMGIFLVIKYLPYALPFVSYNKPYWYFYIIALPLSLLFSHIFLEGLFFQKTVYISFFIAFIELGKMVCSPLYEREMSLPRNEYILLDMALFVILTFFLLALGHLFKKTPLIIRESHIQAKYFLVLYLPISLLIYYIARLISIPILKQFEEAILALIIIPILPLFYDFFSTFIQGYDEQRKLDKALTETRAQVFRYRYSLELEERIKKERHELKNNYLYIQTLLDEKKYDKLQEYLDENIGEKLQKISSVSTGNTMIDYILNRKIAEAHKHGVKVYSEILLPSELPINDDEFCTIFLNLFNNAYEASLSTDNPDIHVTIKCIQSYLSCEISNKVDANQLTNNPDLKTTKEDAANHGLGLKIVKDTITANDGIFTTNIDGNYFKAQFMIPMK